MPSVKLTAIVKRTGRIPPAEMTRKANKALLKFALEMQRAMRHYPPQRSTASGYRRTGTLAKGWQFKVRRPYTIDVFNNVDYAVYVQGPESGRKGKRQAAFMGARGWQTITGEAERIRAQNIGVFVAAVQVRRRGPAVKTSG